MKAKRQKDFPNDWLLYKKLKPKYFRCVAYDEFMQERVKSWDLLPGVALIARVHHLDNGKVRELVFDSLTDFNRFLKRLSKGSGPIDIHCADPQHSFTLQFR